LGCGELLLRLLSLKGPLFSLMRGSSGPFLTLWGLSLAVGAIYQLVNLLFPVWKWHVLDNTSFAEQEFLVIVFGYFVLFHTLALFSRLVHSLLEHGLFRAHTEG
jgi:hypothetical protein